MLPIPEIPQFLEFTRNKLNAVLDQIDILSTSYFPHDQSHKALLALRENVFQFTLDPIEGFSDTDDPDIILQACAEAQLNIDHYFPMLGFILRSTNVRNAFELHAPFQELVLALLGNQAKLVFSSEWDYTPFVYGPLPELKGFVLIGLPASETGNPLVIPAAGHELGHHLWVDRKLNGEILPLIQNSFKEAADDSDSLDDDYVIELRNADDTDVLVEEKEFAQKQCEEMFCDFVGLRIFGEGFLHTFRYLLAPVVEEVPDLKYPPSKSRADALIKAATKHDISSPDGFVTDFTPIAASGVDKIGEDTRDAIIISAAQDQVDFLIKRVFEILDQANIPKPDPKAAHEIYENSFMNLVPAVGFENFADVVNAGWLANLDQNLWENISNIEARKNAVINDLVLKTIEVSEVEKWKSE